MPFIAKEIRWVIDNSQHRFNVVGSCHTCVSHSLSNKGYPLFTIKGKSYLISRLFYSKYYLNGEDIPKGLVVRHKCDNRACINPEHLELGTYADNSRDWIERGRFKSNSCECNPRVKLSKKEVLEIFYSKEPTNVLMIKYNISRAQVNKIRIKLAWVEMTKYLDNGYVKKSKKG